MPATPADVYRSPLLLQSLTDVHSKQDIMHRRLVTVRAVAHTDISVHRTAVNTMQNETTNQKNKQKF